ncbi:MAG: hypothetical protein WDO16_21010 [Bacteroidota bacterium]
MKKILAVLGILLVLFIGYVWFFYFRGKKNTHEGPKPVPMAAGKHSGAFNQNIDSALAAYYNMIEGFVNWDTTTVNKNAAALKNSLENFRLDELQNDTAKDAQSLYATSLDFLANAKNETVNIAQNPLLDKKREALNSLTDNLRNLFLVVHYDGQKIYYQESPTAFNDAYPGYWLSPKEEIRNPYFGTQHPKYKDSMVGDGNSKGVIVKDTGK